MIPVEPRELNTGHLGTVLRVTHRPWAHELTQAPIVVEGPLQRVEHVLLNAAGRSVIRTHLRIGPYEIDHERDAVIEMYGDDDR